MIRNVLKVYQSKIFVLLFLLIASCSASGADQPEPLNNGSGEPKPSVNSGLNGPQSGMFWMVNLPGSNQYKSTVEQVLSENDCLNGIFIRINWDKVEPVKEEYDWNQLDWGIEQANRHNIQYKIMLLPGMHTPEWVYDEGTEAFHSTIPWPLRSDYGQPAKIPIPWNSVYQKYYKEMMEKLADRYLDDDHFAAITLTAANFVYGEMHLPKSNSDIQKWEQYPNYQKRIEDVYKDFTDFYAKTFPQQQMDLHITLPIKGMQNNVRNIIDYGTRNYADQFTLQNAQLTGQLNNQHSFSYKMIMQSLVGTHIGFQSLNSFVEFRERTGSPEVAAYNFVKAKGHYWELLKPDGKSTLFTCKLAALVDSAQTMGATKFKKYLERKGVFDDDFVEQRELMKKYEQEGKYDKALEILNETFRFIEADIEKKVDLLLQARRPQEAITFLKKTVLERSNTAAFHELLANVYNLTGSYDKAATNFEEAYELSNNSIFLFKEGKMYASHNVESKVTAACHSFIEADDYAESAFRRVADLYQNYGYDEALKKLKNEAKKYGYSI